ncbi:MAG: tetratricopeptide repeat protein [Patescibacteria group bacterium]
MKKFLTILWIIILGGAIFIAINKFKPKAEQPKEITKNTEVTETTNPPQAGSVPLPIPRSQSSKTVNEYLKLADNYLEKEYFDKAIDNYLQALELDPDSVGTLALLGEAYLKNNQPDKAKEIFTSASNLNPKSTDLKIYIAKSDLAAREIEKAKDIIWALDQNDNRVKYYKGIILILYKELDNAKKIFEEIAKSDPPEPDTKLTKNTKKFLEAYTTFSYYKESDKVFLELLLAKTLVDVQEYQTAIPLLFAILNTKNNYRDAWIVLGYSYLNINKPADAIDALLQAKALTAEKPETLFFLGLAYFAKNDIDKAIYFVEQADKYGYEPKDQIDLKLGDLYLLKGNDKKAKKYYKEAYTMGSGNPIGNIAAIRYNKLTEKELRKYQVNVSAPNSP